MSLLLHNADIHIILFLKIIIPIRNVIAPLIIEALDIKPESVLSELGCDNGRIIFSCFEKQPHAQYIGIDNGWLPYFLACRNYKRYSSPATHIFTYLMTDLIRILSQKFEKELKLGTRLVSCDFKLPNKMPIKIIDLPATKYQLCEKLYVYEF